MWSLAAQLQMWGMGPSLSRLWIPWTSLCWEPRLAPRCQAGLAAHATGEPGLARVCRRAGAAENHHWTGKKWQPIKITLRGHDFTETEKLTSILRKQLCSLKNRITFFGLKEVSTYLFRFPQSCWWFWAADIVVLLSLPLLTSDGVMTSGRVPGEGPGAVISPRPGNCGRGNQIRMQCRTSGSADHRYHHNLAKIYLTVGTPHASRLFIIIAWVEVQRETPEEVARICVLVLKFT